MNRVLRYAFLFTAILTSGCSEKKVDQTAGHGKYFVQSLGENLNQKNIEESTIVNIVNGNYEYRYGSINAKLLNNPISSRVSRYVYDHIDSVSIPTISHDTITSLNTDGKLIKSRILSNGKLSKIWDKKIYSGICNDLSVALNNGLLITTCGSNIIKAFDFENGKDLWSTEVDNSITSNALFTENLAVFFAKNDAVYALNYNSGKIQWYVPNIINANNRSLFSAVPLLVDGYVIQQTYDDQVRAINALNGQVEWVMSVGNQYKNVKGKEFLNHYGNLTYDEIAKTLYLNNSSGAIVKVKIGSNKPDWVVPAVVSKPVWLLDNIILAVDDLGSVVAFSKADGKKIWYNNILQKIIKKGDDKDIFGKPKPYNEISLTPPVVVNGKIIVISSNKKLIIISPENGRVLEIKNYSQNIYGQPFSHDGKLYVMTDNGRTIIQL